MASLAGAPVSKVLLIAVTFTSIVAATLSRQYYFDLPLSPHLTRDHQYWRLFAHHFAYTNSSELLLGVLLLFFTSPAVERTLGSRKYASFLLVAFVLESATEGVALVLFHRLGLDWLPAGPFGITFAIIHQSLLLIPTLFHFTVFGLTISSRVLLWIPTSQLALSQPSITPLLVILGVLSSTLARSPSLPFSSFIISPKLTLLAARANLFFLGEEPPLRRATLATVETLLAAGTIGPARGPMRNPFASRTAGEVGVVGAANRGLPLPAAPGVVAGAGGAGQVGAAGTGEEAVAVAPTVGIAAHSPTPVPGWREGLTGAQVAPPEELVQSLLRVFPGQPRGVIVDALQRSQERRAADVAAGAVDELTNGRR